MSAENIKKFAQPTQDIINEWATAAKELAAFKAASTSAQYNRIIKRSELKERIRIEHEDEKITEARLEDLALCHPDYRTACDLETNAIIAVGKAEMNLIRAECCYEVAKILWQTKA